MPVIDLANGLRLTLYKQGHVQASEAAYLIGLVPPLRPRLLTAVTRLVLFLSAASHATELQSNWLKKALPSERGNIALPLQHPIGQKSR